ncbi:MAG: hypothetical protein NUV42_00270 [Candidatus Yonathbacteria bacterium]|nr:hypothetical protein [Candidatus Yonathbacteria bacterium]
MNIMRFFKPHSIIAALLITSFLGAPLFFSAPHTAYTAGINLQSCLGGGSSAGSGGSSSGGGGSAGGGGGNEIPVKDDTTRKKTTALENKESCLDSIVTLAVRGFLQKMTGDVIDWINGGFKGKPGFVDNPKRFLGSVADTISGAFINEAGLAGLCDPFRPQILFELAIVPSYKQKAQCTFSGIVDNMNAFANDFNEGGWTAWISTVQPQNNAFGSYFLATDERYSRMLAAQQNARDDANQSRGFLSQYQCDKDSMDDVDFGVDEEGFDIPGDNWDGSATVRSYVGPWNEGGIPGCWSAKKVNLGSVLASQADFALTIDGRTLLAADEVSEAVAAILNTFFNKLLTDGLANLTREKNPDLFDVPDPFEQYRAPLLTSLNTAIASTTAYLTAYNGVLDALNDLVGTNDERIICWQSVDDYEPDPLNPSPPQYTQKITDITKRRDELQKILDTNATVDAQNINAATALLQRLEDILAMITPPNNDTSDALIEFQTITTIPSQEDIDAAGEQLLIYTEELFGPGGAQEDLSACQEIQETQLNPSVTP